MRNTHVDDTDFESVSGEQQEDDLNVRQVDPFQDVAYHTPLQSPAQIGGHLQPVGQNDSLLAQAPHDTGQSPALVAGHYQLRFQDSLENDTDLDDDWS